MTFHIIATLALPFIGTTLGAALALFVKGTDKTRGMLGAFGGGIMMAASVWSLLIPAIEASEGIGAPAFLPAALGFIIGVCSMLLIDIIISNIGKSKKHPSREGCSMLTIAVTIHNFPEGMALGVALGAALSGGGISLVSVMALSFGIAIQNIPEGAIIVMPTAPGRKKASAFLFSIASAAVELLGAIFMLLLSELLLPALPYTLAFAAGAMVYVVVEELIPEAKCGDGVSVSAIAFALGFALMMALDVAFS